MRDRERKKRAEHSVERRYGLGSFKSESFGIDPGFFWQPEFGGGKLSIVGKYMRDLTATNRFESDYGTVGVAWTF